MVFFSLPVKSEKEKVQGFAGYAIRIYPPQGRKKQTETSLFAGKYQSFVQRNMSSIWPCKNKYKYLSFDTKGILKNFFFKFRKGVGSCKIQNLHIKKKWGKFPKGGGDGFDTIQFCQKKDIFWKIDTFKGEGGGGFWANPIRNSFSKNLKFPKLFIVNKSSPIHVYNKKILLIVW